jgi:crooked neck
MCPKDKLFKGYIELEIELREFDRCRILYEKYLEFNPQNCTTWVKFAELETILGDYDRVRGIYELAIQQHKLDMPEIVWKSFIDFEVDQQEYTKCRQLYKRLLEKTQHVKVWLSYAQFEANNNFDDEGQPVLEAARSVYRKAYSELKNTDNSNESRLLILEAWKEFEVRTCPLKVYSNYKYIIEYNNRFIQIFLLRKITEKMKARSKK